MADIPAWLLPHSVVVETYRGTTGLGDTWDPPEELHSVKVDETRRFVRDTRGDEVVSETTIYARLHRADRFPPGSKVTTNGRTAIVISCKRHDDGGAGGWQHVEVVLT